MTGHTELNRSQLHGLETNYGLNFSYYFIYNIFNDAASSSEYIESKSMIIIANGCGIIGNSTLEGLRTTTKIRYRTVGLNPRC
jgi:hypothetical protein